MTDTNNSFSFESTNLINFFIKRFKPLATITLTGAVISIIVALSIKPRFESTVVLFPTHATSISNDLMSGNLGTKDILKLGKESEVEQLLQILNSEDVRDMIVVKFDLFEHYGIGDNTTYKKTKLERIYNNNVSFNRTEFMSIQINVLDEDPQYAADIANALSVYVDTSLNKMKKERAQLALKLVENEYITIQEEMQLLQDSMKILQQLGINHYESQSEVFNDAYAQALINNAKPSYIKLLEDKIQILSDHGVAYTTIRNQLIYETERLSKMRSRYMEAKIDYEQELPHTFIVDRAIKAEKKTKPVRWLIVAVSTFSTFMFAFLLLIILESFGGRLAEMKSVNLKNEKED